jgi:hypothetical protein
VKGEQLKSDGLLNNTEHHGLIPLPGVKPEQLLQMRKPLRPFLRLLVNIVDRIILGDVGVGHFLVLLRGEFVRQKI